MKLTYLLTAAGLFIAANNVALANGHDSHADHHAAVQPATEQLIETQGVIKQIDLTNHKVTITHEPIASIGWPAMTMRFTAEDNQLLANLNVNDKVRFKFVQQGNLSILRSIDVVQ